MSSISDLTLQIYRHTWRLWDKCKANGDGYTIAPSGFDSGSIELFWEDRIDLTLEGNEDTDMKIIDLVADNWDCIDWNFIAAKVLETYSVKTKFSY